MHNGCGLVREREEREEDERGEKSERKREDDEEERERASERRGGERDGERGERERERERRERERAHQNTPGSESCDHLFPSVETESGKQISIDECCKDGRVRGIDNQDCTVISLISESTTCRIVQEQCCTAMCCDCCLLGQAVQEQGLTCDHSLSLGYQCGLVSRGCCNDGAPDVETKNSLVSDKDNETLTDKDNPLPNNMCSNGLAKCAQECVGNFTCACFKGYKLKPDGKNCEDINECLLGASNCRGGEHCINTVGSFRCQREVSCGTGYELTDSNNCKDIDECESGTHNCTPDFECQNTQGSFHCLPKNQCGDGYIQDAMGSCIEPCHPGQSCMNTVGSFTCQRNSINCGRGYHLNDDGNRCVDIDECKGPDGACAGHSCINLVGSFRCECKAGFIFNSIRRLCEDINECRHYPGRLCAHKCENALGSYKCICTQGFKLASDGRNCDDIDECALPTRGHICSYHCHNTPGSFHCICPATGYILAPNGRSCQDVDECVTGTHTCSETESCFNVQGGFRCLSFECPPNYRQTGETECLASPLRITYYQLTFPTNIPVPTNVFRMGPSNTVSGDHVQIAIVGGNEGSFFSAQRVPSGGVMAVAAHH
ncbi:unnamed protein product [Coregonus sp. 'balchen']|nr:unnamed protein product [Coregonus sp. 'balchen']